MPHWVKYAIFTPPLVAAAWAGAAPRSAVTAPTLSASRPAAPSAATLIDLRIVLPLGFVSQIS